jgi:hypothetical protein
VDPPAPVVDPPVPVVDPPVPPPFVPASPLVDPPVPVWLDPAVPLSPPISGSAQAVTSASISPRRLIFEAVGMANHSRPARFRSSYKR